jgi:pyruvate/2-oxoglutarate dehydrogenase complex dihydrolipoamide acyltransferase (E2) component
MEIRIPELSKDPNAEITLSAWFKTPGESFSTDEPIAELLFDKAAFDLYAPAAGKLKEIKVPERGKGHAGDVIATYEEAN